VPLSGNENSRHVIVGPEMARTVCDDCRFDIAPDEPFVKIGERVYHARCWERLWRQRERATGA
jgi:hypothetical protein